MKEVDIIEALQSKLAVPSGRHLYGVLGSFQALEKFSKTLRKARMADGKNFPKALDVNSGILKVIPDDEMRKLVSKEAQRPEPTSAHVQRAFEEFLRENLKKNGLIVLTGLEMLFAYSVELHLLRSMARDDNRILMLLPGIRSSGKVKMYPYWDRGSYDLPINLIAENHLWELKK